MSARGDGGVHVHGQMRVYVRVHLCGFCFMVVVVSASRRTLNTVPLLVDLSRLGGNVFSGGMRESNRANGQSSLCFDGAPNPERHVSRQRGRHMLRMITRCLGLAACV